jgi:hypothetical protein
MNILMESSTKRMPKGIFLLLTSLLVTLISCSGPSGNSGRNLEAGFQNPPESAKPRVWWHWMNGNITKEGIRADLEWMKRAGIGGFQNFDAALTTPQVVNKRLVYMTPEWKDAFLFTTKLADSLGLEMAIAGSPGWSESGGPWVTPAQAMKKFVWSETSVEGGKPFTDTLRKPPTSTGTFQNIAIKNPENGAPIPEYYADAAVVAYRVPENDISMKELKPRVTSSSGKFELAGLTDGDLVKSAFLPAAPPDKKSWIQFEFAKSETIQSLTIVAVSQGGRANRALETSDDGIQFKTLLEIPGSGTTQKTMTFPPATARYFRITFTTPPPPTASEGSASTRGQGAIAPAGMQIAELDLHRVARVNRFEDKAGFSSLADLYSLATPEVSSNDVINKNEVIDLTSKMQPDGKLSWTPPEGRWIVMRLGYSLTGKTNHPASPEATGLEVDKLSAEHCKAYFTNYLDQYKDATGGLMGKKGLQFIITDSWEAGTLNWTDRMITEFGSRCGYDMLPWLPVLTGHIVGSAEASDQFLWDFRKTIADLTAENHYDQLTTLLHERGMGRYSESHEGGRALVADGMDVKRKADIPMSATWTPRIVGSNSIATVSKADVRESASVAHIYGQNLVAAESMTAIGTPWAWSPEFLKPTADMELTSGLNRFVIHCSVHQPVNDKIPGLGLGPYGQWFTRHETWAEEAYAWTTYLARNSYMLQQGKFIADVAYFYGEDNNITALFRNKLPDVPDGFNYDFVNADALKNVLSVENGQITTPSGMHYHILALDSNSQQMSLPILRKIYDMVKAGALVVGPKPTGTPSMSDDKAEFKTIADELWTKEKGENNVGKGKVFAGRTIGEVLAAIKVDRDFEYTKPQGNTELLFVHRRLNDIDIYWVNNRNNRVEDLVTTFRVTGKAPEIWHPETGVIEKASYNTSEGHTAIPLTLQPNDAVFVVFRKKAKSSSLKLIKPVETQLAVIDGAWNVSFQPNRGAPSKIVLEQLTSWSENADSGVKYFSGTGTYTKTIQANPDWFKKGSQIWIDLGSVKNLAEVAVNGKSLGIVWKTPFRVNVTNYLKQGENVIEVKVTDLWVNRLIGDMQPGTNTKITYTTQPFYQADSPLLPSGLLGPVKIVGVTF